MRLARVCFSMLDIAWREEKLCEWSGRGDRKRKSMQDEEDRKVDNGKFNIFFYFFSIFAYSTV
jgi:hypothetical protein